MEETKKPITKERNEGLSKEQKKTENMSKMGIENCLKKRIQIFNRMKTKRNTREEGRKNVIEMM
jgi:hypothetical protein